MKIAISGKGGTGKSTLAAALALLLAREGQRVLAIDADPDGNLAAALGATPAEQRQIIPIAQRQALIEERTGAQAKQYGQMFKLNPEVSDIAENYATQLQGVWLLVLGAIQAGGSGCACPESVLLRALVTDLVLYRDDTVILDMEAGIEHLGRGTAQGVDLLIVMVEPSQRAVDSALRIVRLAGEIGLRAVRFVANKIASPADEKFVRHALAGHEFLGVIPWLEEIRHAERQGLSVLDGARADFLERLRTIRRRLPAARTETGGAP